MFSGGRWTEDADTQPASPYLRVDIHDSDFAQVTYGPAEAGHGRFYLGFEPATHFEDLDASQPVDAVGEARGFSAWAERAAGGRVANEEVLPLLAHPDGSDPVDIFVEDTVVTLLRLAGLPLPQALRQDV